METNNAKYLLVGCEVLEASEATEIKVNHKTTMEKVATESIDKKAYGCKYV